MRADVDEALITRIIVEDSLRHLSSLTELDVAVVGAGPAGLTVARLLAKRGFKTAVFERRLSFGGGMGGGGMQLPRIVVEEEAAALLAELGCRLSRASNGLYVADAAEALARLAAGAVEAGANILLGVSVEDVVYRGAPPRIVGVVIQWSSVQLSGLHVDPLAFKARATVDCTGHEASVIAVASRKVPGLGVQLKGEGAMWAGEGERLVVERSGRVCPGLYAAGMSVAALYGLPRMGPIFGGMLLSGRKAAEEVARDLAEGG
ncbi:MAG: ribose 1,5-bisphosphate isomerase [Thermoprotei archaeon]|nr:MAG: ribose 1,5-bisphosphate isomerase [Thermoprotei archaeon]